MGRYRGKRIPDEYDPGYAKKEGMEETWYWYMAGYEDGLSDDYNREYPKEMETQVKAINSLHETLAAQERVLHSVSAERDILKRRLEELQTLGNNPEDTRINEEANESFINR